MCVRCTVWGDCTPLRSCKQHACDAAETIPHVRLGPTSRHVTDNTHTIVVLTFPIHTYRHTTTMSQTFALRSQPVSAETLTSMREDPSPRHSTHYTVRRVSAPSGAASTCPCTVTPEAGRALHLQPGTACPHAFQQQHHCKQYNAHTRTHIHMNTARTTYPLHVLTKQLSAFAFAGLQADSAGQARVTTGLNLHDNIASSPEHNQA